MSERMEEVGGYINGLSKEKLRQLLCELMEEYPTIFLGLVRRSNEKEGDTN
ncbi:hypothetical protein [uncultured Vagococcus sp.]|uniref:hypothetical protein n=1 Tax=uncultured Vagococcus sp. TaxID=189676 RepID=UPI0028D17228|nr:hypothetical protein [uncultured Vagococcus sp.]